MSELDEAQADALRQWVQKAENDLKNASHALKLGADCPTDEEERRLTDYATVARYPGDSEPNAVAPPGARMGV